jgi:metallo-beta-lactamase family protein
MSDPGDRVPTHGQERFMHLEFHGAARGVTGSCHLLQANGHRILLDCGLFQGPRDETEKLNRKFGFNPREIDAVVMSHAHIDHSGDLPGLVKNGFEGTIHATLATADLLTVMLRDSAKIQEHDLAYVNKKRHKHHQPPKEALYTMDDADDAIAQVEGHRYHRPVPVVPGITATFYDAGHILGSSTVQLEISEGNEKRTLVFSGDLGRKHLPILRDPETPPEADALIIESTYGDREHAPIEEVDDRLSAIINRVFAEKGKLIIPAFAVGRTQELVYAISRLLRTNRIPSCGVYVDSPLAVNVTEIFDRHPECYDAEIRKVLRRTGDPFGFELLDYVRSVEESKALNAKKGPFIVISASGMMEGGRVLHHLKNAIGNPANLVLIVGYQAVHTLGRRLEDGASEVRIFGEPYERKAQVEVMNEFSAHADRNELMAWVAEIERKPAKAFVVHGEESQSLAFAERLREDAGIGEVVVPSLHQKEAL